MINKKIENLIIKEKLQNLSLSTRRLSQIMKEKYNIILSKSSIHNILKEHNLGGKIYKKSGFIEYLSPQSIPLGLLFYIFMDRLLGLSKFFSRKLFKESPPEISSYALFLLWASRILNIPPQGLLKFQSLARLYRSPVPKSGEILKYPEPGNLLLSDIEELRDNFVQVKSYRLNIPSEKISLYIDPQLRSITSTISEISKLIIDKERLRREIFEPLCIFCISGFEYPSYVSILLTEHLLKQGRINLEVVDREERVVRKIDLEKTKFIMGFYPPAFKKGLKIKGYGQEISFSLSQEFDRAQGVTLELIYPPQEKSIESEGVLLKEGKIVKWALLSNLPLSLALKEYFLRWREIQREYKLYLRKIGGLRGLDLSGAPESFSPDALSSSLVDFIISTLKKAFYFLVGENIPPETLKKIRKLELEEETVIIEGKELTKEGDGKIKNIAYFFNNFPYPSIFPKIIINI